VTSKLECAIALCRGLSAIGRRGTEAIPHCGVGEGPNEAADVSDKDSGNPYLRQRRMI